MLESKAQMLLLASRSPRRQQFLALAGWPYRVLGVSVNEKPRPQESAEQLVQRLAWEKAWAAGSLWRQTASPPDDGVVIVAADTAVVVNRDGGEQVLGKPANALEAEAMLRCLRGRKHRVLTGLVVMRPADGDHLQEVISSQVFMRAYDDEEMLAYIASGDPFDKAGAYAIQHPAFNPVAYVHGCYANVMGLPLCRLGEMLATLGLEYERSLLASCKPESSQPCQAYLFALGSLDWQE